MKDEEDYTPLPKDTTPAANGIPEFWLTTLRNHIALNDMITDRDADALKSLVDVRLEYLTEGENKSSKTQGKPGFKILFEFSKNAYFDNEILEKTYLYQEEVGYSGDFVYDRALGTKIKWKEDKDLTKEFEIKKQRNKSMFMTCLAFLNARLIGFDRHQPHSPRAQGPPHRLFLQLLLPTRAPHRRGPGKRRIRG